MPVKKRKLSHFEADVSDICLQEYRERLYRSGMVWYAYCSAIKETFQRL
jgi:hypothetical protein